MRKDPGLLVYGEVFLLQNCTEEARNTTVQYRETTCFEGNKSTNVLAINAQHMNSSNCWRVHRVGFSAISRT